MPGVLVSSNKSGGAVIRA